MFTSLFAFLGGSAFRMIWGEVSNYLTKYQDQKHEKEMMLVQSQLDDKRAEREAAQLRLSHELGVRMVEVQRDAEVAKAEADAFKEAMAQAFKPTGIMWLDAWNGCIRPAGASIALGLWALILYRQGFTPTPWDLDLVAGMLGFFFADRSLGRRGK
jgi:hypothetical protein